MTQVAPRVSVKKYLDQVREPLLPPGVTQVKYPYNRDDDAFRASAAKGYRVVPPENGRPAYAVFQESIRKSDNDEQEYRLILLENGLEALVISDPTTKKSSAAMDIRVGHLSDPDDLPGLAHFCEHLMFLGTGKYPKENEYSEYLNSNGGDSNAFTSTDSTCYYFEVASDALPGALDRFAQFFIDPLFDASCTEREANAVNSENTNNLQSDMWRLFQLDKTTSLKEHPYSKFGTGNLQTLWTGPNEKGIDVRSRLIEWQRQHYSSNLMKLCVLGKESLDKLTELVVDHLHIAPNRQLPLPSFAGSPYGEEQVGSVTFVKAVKDVNKIELSFPFYDDTGSFAMKPGGFLSHFFGHEGAGSLLSYLKRQDWALNLVSHSGTIAHGFGFFKVEVELTPKGLEEYEKVIAAVFEYADLLRSSQPLPDWVFNEVKALHEIAFRFAEKMQPSQYTVGMCQQMSRPYPRQDLLAAAFVVSENWHELFAKSIDLVRPELCRVILSSQNIAHPTPQREPWYGTEYGVSRLELSTLDAIRADLAMDKEFHLPEQNPFIPQDLSLKENRVKPETQPETFQVVPDLLTDSDRLQLWHKIDDRWFTPTAECYVLIESPELAASPLADVQSDLFVQLLTDQLTEFSYNALMADMRYAIVASGHSLRINVSGYNDRIMDLLQAVLKTVTNYTVDPSRFNVIKETLKRALQNRALDQPYRDAMFGVSYMTSEQTYKYTDKLEAIDQVTVESLTEHIAKVLSSVYTKAFVFGNVTRDEARRYGEAILTAWPNGFAPLPKESRTPPRSLLIPEGHHVYRDFVPNVNNANSSLEQFAYVGDILDVPRRAALTVIELIAHEPAYDVLRTQEQLGYIVTTALRKQTGFMGLRVIIQSQQPPAYLESRIDAFWQSFHDKLKNLTDDEVEKFKKAAIDRMHQDKSLHEEGAKLWIHIASGYYGFHQRETDIAAISALTKDDILGLFESKIHPSSPNVQRMSVYMQSKMIPSSFKETLAAELGISVEKYTTFNDLVAEHPDKEKPLHDLFVKSLPVGTKIISDMDTYKEGAEKGPLPVPTIPLTVVA